MRRDLILLGFIVAVFGVGALLAPPVYVLAQSLAAHVPAWRGAGSIPFVRLLTRILLVLAIAGLWPLLRLLRLTWTEAGVTRPDWLWAARGAVPGVLVLGALVSLEAFLHVRTGRPSVSAASFLQAVVFAACAALVVGPLEELIFRGVLFGVLRQCQGWVPALVVSSMIFAAVHFLHSAEPVGAVRWRSGFDALWQMAQPGGLPGTWLPQFINLLVCGGVLAWVYQRSGNLWAPIGLHAALIFCIKMANSATVTRGPAMFWGSRRVIDGWAATGALVILACAIPLFVSRKPIA